RKVRLETPVHPDYEHVSSSVPLNHAKPIEALANEEHVSTNASDGQMGILQNQTDEHVTPYPVANVELMTCEEKGQENVNPAFANEGHDNNKDGLSGLRTQPSPAHRLDQRLEFVEKPACNMVVPDAEAIPDESAMNWSWKLLCQSAHHQANTVLHFEALTEEHANLVYAHESCKNIKVRYKECKKELANFNRLLMKKYWLMRRKKAETEEVYVKQSEADTHQLRVDREKFVVECGNREMVRRKIINEYLPTFVRRLHQSAEYKRSLGEAFSLAIGKGFIDGISIGRQDLDVARAYLLDPTSLQNVVPDETCPTLGGGPRDTPTASYA
ncbi:hypothetical protein Tco_1131529, partial [Tanacetum coccineum]